MNDVRDMDTPVEIPLLDVTPPPRRALALRVMSPLLRVVTRPPAKIGSVDLDARQDLGARQAYDPRLEPRRSPSVVRISLILVVALPILVSGIYLFAIASDQYAAETSFAVRANSNLGGDNGGSGDTSISGLLSGSGSLGGQDASIVANYIHSRAIIEDISRKTDLRAIFRRPEADILAKLPANASIEDLTDYWRSMVSVYIEPTSGIVSVETRAFRRDDALTLAKAVVAASETLVADLSANVRADAMKHAEEELKRNEGLVRFALDDLTAFRNAQGLIDPVKSADQTGRLLVQLMGEAIQTETQLFVAQRVTGPNAPGIAGTRSRLESINDHIVKLKAQLAGDETSRSNMAAAISRFEELELKKQFAERMYSFARDGIDRARLIAEQRSVYIAVFVPPSLPEDFSYPLRFSDFAIISVALMIAWSSGATIWASVLDHRL